MEADWESSLSSVVTWCGTVRERRPGRPPSWAREFSAPRPAPTPRRISRSASAATATLQERVDELEAKIAGVEQERNEAVQQAAEYQERALQWEAYATAAEHSGAERDLSLRRVASGPVEAASSDPASR